MKSHTFKRNRVTGVCSICSKPKDVPVHRKAVRSSTDRFVAPRPVIIPRDATEAEREALRFGRMGRPS